MTGRPLLVAVERCHLCGRTKKQFTCALCVSSGNFLLSSDRKKTICSISKREEGHDELRYADKKKRLKIVVAVRDDYFLRLSSLLEVQRNDILKNDKLIHIKNHIENLKTVIQELRSATENERSQVAEKTVKIEQKKLYIERLISKTEKLKTSSRLKEKKLKAQHYKEKLVRKNTDLRAQRLFHVKALLTDIFPLCEQEVYPEFGTPPRSTLASHVKCDDVVSEVLSTTEQELEEATRTVHIGGRWISQASAQIEQTIVGVGLPTTDEFMKYFEWLKSYRNEPRNPQSQPPLHDICILRIPSSLIYTAQLTDVLSFLLAVNLPHKVDYSNFGLLQVSRQRLYQTINKLSQNITYLSYSQLVPLSEIDPSNFLKTLMICSSEKNPNLAWIGPFETFDYWPLECQFDSDSSAEELEYDNELDSASIEQEDWDKLMELPPDQSYNETPSASFMDPSSRDQSITSSASGLVTSAAASLASALWSFKRQ